MVKRRGMCVGIVELVDGWDGWMDGWIGRLDNGYVEHKTSIGLG